jgi:hypothetical protein
MGRAKPTAVNTHVHDMRVYYRQIEEKRMERCDQRKLDEPGASCCLVF